MGLILRAAGRGLRTLTPSSMHSGVTEGKGSHAGRWLLASRDRRNRNTDPHGDSNMRQAGEEREVEDVEPFMADQSSLAPWPIPG
jgi:hypothetical protein